MDKTTLLLIVAAAVAIGSFASWRAIHPESFGEFYDGVMKFVTLGLWKS